MKNMKKNLLILGSILMILSVLFVACSGESAENGEAEEAQQQENKSLTFGLFNWAENIAVTNMWKVLLEERGYEVEIITGDKSPVWTGVSEGDLDVHFESWMPVTDKPLWDEYKDSLDEYGPWYEGTQLGLAVPTYVEIDSIEELNGHKENFEQDGQPQIVGIDSGSSLMKLTQEAHEEYGLDMELVSSSGPVMVATLQKAVADQEDVVVTLWKPHWIFAEIDLKFLDDPKNIYGQDESIYFVAHESFKETNPQVLEWMQNWKMDDQSLGSLMAAINEADSPEAGATAWIEDNSELVESWFE
ncbi:MAG: glycine betaine ABC transporter substrate-binding protein [Spirochaetota bacterium]